MKLLIVYALESEKISLHIKDAEQVEVTTGIGKTQAAASLAFAIAEHQPDAVLNIGTVGSYRHNVGDILVSRHFVDRDMQRLPIDGVCRELDMSDLSWGTELPSVIDGQAMSVPVRINTGDNFVFSPEEDLGCDAVDMESFAMAWTCRRVGVPFLSVKYVTDKLGENSVEAWAAKLEHARSALQAYFERYL
ncbi:MAG: nucleosidase [Bacteroidaceae bacterium]|nr:nucleosidase [Bacteroidaceae bacterium]